MKTNNDLNQTHTSDQLPRSNYAQSPAARWGGMAALSLCLLALVLVTGCASTKVSNQQRVVIEQLPEPGTIWVYDFAATAADVPVDSALRGQYAGYSTPQTPEEIATGRELGDQIATELVQEILDMGMVAQKADAHTKPKVYDLVIRGYLVAMVEGSEAKRMTIGFGSGASELTTAVEGSQMTPNGLRKIGSGTVTAGGGKGPGGALGVAALIATHNPVGLIVGTGVKVYGEKSGSAKVEGRAKSTAKEIAEVLKKRFQDQGWIN